MNGEHRDLTPRIAEPDRRLEAGREAAEPRVGEVVRRPGLPGGRRAEVGARARAARHVLLEDPRDLRGDPVRDDALALRDAPAGLAIDLAAGEDDLPDRHRLRVDPARGDRRVGGSEVERRDDARAEAHRRDVGAVARAQVGPHAERVRHLRDVLRADVECEACVDGVVRAQRPVLDRRRPDVRVVVRLRAPRGRRVRVARARLGRVVLEGRGEVLRRRADPLRDRGGEHEHLERGAGLSPCGRREVHLVLRITRADLGHRPDRPVCGVDRHDRRRRVGRIRQRPLDRVERQLLQARIDRRVDAQPAAPHRVRPVLLLQLVAHVAEEVRLADARVQAPGLQVQVAVGDGVGVLRRRDVAVPEHRTQHLVPPGDRLLRAVEGVENRRRLRQSREQGRLRQRQMARPLGEVRLGSRLDPVRTVAVENLVDVGVEDPALRLLARELDRKACLRRLAAERLRGLLDVQVARELLRDRRAALHDVARPDVREQRARDAGVVERAVLPEAAVLDRHRRARHPFAHVGEIDRLAVLLGRDRAEQRAVGGVHEGVLADVDRLEVVELAAGHPDGGAREAGHDEYEEHRQRRACDEVGDAPAMLAHALAALAPDVREQLVGLAAPSASSGRRGHAYTPSARSTS